MKCPERPRDRFGRIKTRPGTRAEDEAILEALERFDAGESFEAIGAALCCGPDVARSVVIDVLMEEAGAASRH